jgi:DNA repair exonuclease SbcCD nuclease subunit
MTNQKMSPYREKKVFQTDDGRIIEQFEKVGEIEMDLAPEMGDIDESEVEFDDYKVIFLGVTTLVDPTQGAREFRFKIESPSLEDAFAKYYEARDAAFEELKAQMKQQMEESQNRIVEAPASALQDVDKQNDIKNNVLKNIIPND